MKASGYIRILFSAALLFALQAVVSAQEKEDTDSLVRLVSANRLQQVEINGVSYRKAFGGNPGGPATFLHNNTYLICDTAFWNMSTNVIDAWGNVKLLQEETVLTSDKLTYIVDQDLAEFRGTLVQLVDKYRNTLSIKNLDSNTRDSLAIFRNGGALRDKDGQTIESIEGTYDSKKKVFTFDRDVNMFSDTMFVKTTHLEYESPRDEARFYENTNVWKDDNMLSADAGWYHRSDEMFCFRRNVHVMSENQEGWCDTLWFNRLSSDVTMDGHAQVTDTTRSVSAVAGHIFYEDSTSTVTMVREPAIIAWSQNGTKVDSTFIGADLFIYKTVMRFEVDSTEVLNSQKRLEDSQLDPVTNFRRQAAEAAAKAAEEAAEALAGTTPDNPPQTRKQEESDSKSKAKAEPEKKQKEKKEKKSKKSKKGETEAPVSIDTLRDLEDSILAAGDSLRALAGIRDSLDSIAPALDSLAAGDSTAFVPDSLKALEDSILNAGQIPDDGLDTLGMTGLDSLSMEEKARADSIAIADSIARIPKDSTKIGFLTALHNVKIWRETMQVVCDSLLYTDLDSLGRMYENPSVFNEGNHQYNADSIFVVIENSALKKANLMSNSFIHINEDDVHFDQIRGAEIVAYFDSQGDLERLDALGGANALFFIEENDALATVNKKDSKMLSALFKEGSIDRVYYFEAPKSDAYPVVQLAEEEQRFKGFLWTPERRPDSPKAITTIVPRPGERTRYSKMPKATFKYTDIYFPGYIRGIYKQIAARDSLNRVLAIEGARRKDSLELRHRLDSIAMADSIARFKADSTALADSLAKFRADSLAAVSDSIARAAADSLAAAAPADSLKAPVQKTPEEIKAEKKALAEAEKARKAEERVAKKKARDEAREKKWAELDQRDELKAKAKEEKKAAALRKNKKKALEAQAKQEAKEARLIRKASKLQ
ncbi:MAG: hypothetical protein MJY56_03310 [Bacteroidales bacterium]|nr:hypothetical protein [Bacteroidales bacterium]